MSRLPIAFVASFALVFTGVPAAASATQSLGPISVKQVLELFDTIQTDPESPKLLYAYLAGIGETAGALISSAKKQGGFANCGKSLSLDGETVQAALRKAGPENTASPATPIIIEDMLARAACK